jgi:putative tryptophan/tyrosine transport system substrate-binding protein
MISRRHVLAALIGAAWGDIAWAQAKGKPPAARIGVLTSGNRATATAWLQAFREGLRSVSRLALGIELRFADGSLERLPALADELAKRGVRMIVATDERAAAAAKTTSVPVVTADVAGAAELGQKQVELLTTLLPKLSRVALVVNPANSSHRSLFNGLGAAAQAKKIRVLAVEAINADEIESAFALMRSNRAGAAVFAPDGLFSQEADRIAELALRGRLPVIAAMPGFAPAGGLASYGVDPRAAFRLAALKVERLLDGAKPADLAADESPRFPLIINRKAAAAIGVAIPDSVLKRADRVIE